MREEQQGSESFYEELEEQELASFNRHLRGKRTGRGGRAGAETEAMYKEALMDSIFGRFQEASRKLKLMITLTPDTPEPYHLLGTMHEQLGELDKAAEYLFMSTYLSAPSLQKWLRVGELSFERRMFSQAAYCFGRALKIANCDPRIMVRRAQAFELAGQPKKAIATYKRLMDTASSPEYAKKYARLRFRRGEYSQCREILQQQPNFMEDAHLVYMACETYLKEKDYENAAALVEKHLEAKEQDAAEGEQLPCEFLLILLVCSVGLGRNCYGYSAAELINAAKDCYEASFSELYAEAVNHMTNCNQALSFELVNFLLTQPAHQTVANYILAADYLCRMKNQSCVALLQTALLRHPGSPQLLAQQNYVLKCLGMASNKPPAKPEKDDAIYYSDDDSPPAARRPQPATEDPQIIVKLMQNINSSLKILLSSNSTDASSHEQVLSSLDFLIGLAPAARERTSEKEGLYLSRISRRRGDGQSGRGVGLYGNLQLAVQYFQGLVQYMIALVKTKQYKRLSQVGERVSKVHAFKNQNRRAEFAELKVKIYEMSLLGCLAIRKFNAALFFMRYLAAKHPEDQLYRLALHLLLRLCRKKTFLSSALSKRLESPNGHHLAQILAIQYMDTGCFELAVSTFLKSTQDQNQPKDGMLQLCLAACLLQLASSRNTYNKLDFVNRSALCLASYQQIQGDTPQVLFNRGRWLAQLKINHKAIECFEKVLDGNCEQSLRSRAAYCLQCIYKDTQQYQKAAILSRTYFSITNEVII